MCRVRHGGTTLLKEAGMKVSNGKMVSIEYTMFHENGERISTNAGATPLSFVQGQHEIIQGLEQSLDGLENGASKTVLLPPEDAYGIFYPEDIMTIPIAQLPDDARVVGAVVETRDSENQIMAGIVQNTDNGNATINFNHPLAGKTIRFDIKILSVTAEGETGIA